MMAMGIVIALILIELVLIIVIAVVVIGNYVIIIAIVSLVVSTVSAESNMQNQGPGSYPYYLYYRLGLNSKLQLHG